MRLQQWTVALLQLGAQLVRTTLTGAAARM
jgi:hypothetical protein